ncbi:MAG TPA: hypothetical protein ENH33_07335 [Actinobacteria bacterium]|nr:hypothetical protein [Actinomycetota bacterium]
MSGDRSPSVGLSRGPVIVALEDMRLVRSDAEGVEQFHGAAVADARFLFDAGFGLARTPQGLGSSISVP